LKVATGKEHIDNTVAGKKSLRGPRSNYWTDWIITTPTVKAIMTPTIITLDACWVMRVTVVKIEIPSMAAINAAGAITKGISLVNQMSVCIFFFLVNDSCYAGNRVNIVIQPDISTRQSKMARRTELATIYVIKINLLIWFMVRCALIDSGGSEL